MNNARRGNSARNQVKAQRCVEKTHTHTQGCYSHTGYVTHTKGEGVSSSMCAGGHTKHKHTTCEQLPTAHHHRHPFAYLCAELTRIKQRARLECATEQHQHITHGCLGRGADTLAWAETNVACQVAAGAKPHTCKPPKGGCLPRYTQVAAEAATSGACTLL